MTLPLNVSSYRIFTTEFDKEIYAHELLNNLPGALKNKTPMHSHYEDIDPVVAAPHFGERPLVTFLVDHSGSMKGAPAQWTVSALRQVGSLLEKSGIEFELLGFTTRSWQGGYSRKKWIAEGMPPFPGRLCDLLHIVYRDAISPSPNWAEGLGLMTIPEVLKENIDGEALIWAYKRACTFEPSFWLCIVISDGAPVDDSTLLSNPTASEKGNEILHQHLVDAIAAIDAKPNTQISGFGVNFDVAEYYEDSDCALTDTEGADRLANFVRHLLTSYD